MASQGQAEEKLVGTQLPETLQLLVEAARGKNATNLTLLDLRQFASELVSPGLCWD